MNTLPRTTMLRLQKIPQIPSVWEGDRRPFTGMRSNELSSKDADDCIIWVDGSEGVVRAFDIVTPDMGREAVVRTLLKAIENPQSHVKPARPQKIVVRDRELQFFLRGALQSLDIQIDYEPKLPIIDELFEGFDILNTQGNSILSPDYLNLLTEVAKNIWDVAPWEVLADHDIISIKIALPDIEPIYACVMGMLGREFGVVLYRSLESMKQFRSTIMEESSIENLEKAFLSQDCWFLNFESEDDFEFEDEEEEEFFDLTELDFSEIAPLFGSIHPYEGMRPLRDEEEASLVYLALQSFVYFCQDYEDQLSEETILKIEKQYQISTPFNESIHSSVSVVVTTQPELTAEFVDLNEDDEVTIHQDLVPDNKKIHFSTLSSDLIDIITSEPKIYCDNSASDYPPSDKPIPVIIIQTTRPKAKKMLERLEEAGDVIGLSFVKGSNHYTDTMYDLGIIQTGDLDLYIFGEFPREENTQSEFIQKWLSYCEQNDGVCGFIISMGVTGTSRNQPQIKDMIAFWQINIVDLGLDTLYMQLELE